MSRCASCFMALVVVTVTVTVTGCNPKSSDDTECNGSASCSNHGTCDDSSGEVVCTCDTGYTGERCDACAPNFLAVGSGVCDPVTPCVPNVTCSGHGVCDDSSGVADCSCEPGYVGESCDGCDSAYMDYGDGECRPIEPCVTLNTCASQNRTCEADQGVAVCGDCLPGYQEENSACIQTCAAESNPGQLVPLDLYIMLDRSASMTTDDKWTAVTDALEAFVQSADASGIGVGLQYFPLAPDIVIPVACSSDPECGIYGPCLPQQGGLCAGSKAPDTSCDPDDYSVPEVPIATLPSVEATLLASLAANSPEGMATPSQTAMLGAVTYATAWAQSHPGHLTFIVFATDGLPTGCVLDNTIEGTAALALAASSATPFVKTFVIGVGTELTSLNQIAVAGDTGQAYLVDTGGDVTGQFIGALNEIRATGLCLYQIPEPQSGDPNYDMINVSIAPPGAPDDGATLYNVADEASCDPVTGGWYYDDPLNPEMILLCPESCEEVSLGGLDVNILVGCVTIVG